MTAFRAPVEDILISLRDVAGADRLGSRDAALGEDLLRHFAGFAEAVIAPLDALGDREGCRLDGGRVTLPAPFRSAYRQLAEAGWQGLTVPEALGGAGADAVTAATLSEVFSGACHALQMVCNLVPGAVTTLLRFGTQAQQADWIPRLARGEVLATMCLTEGGAGSDLSRIRARARRAGDGWRIDGEKIFISGGDQDLSEGILHLVLARSGEAESGTAGLSLFLCPKGGGHGRNGVEVTRIEAKLGIHASPTCALRFDGARAELIGVEGGGLAAMFTVMNHARLDVALQGVAHAARAHAISLDHASQREQGRRADGGAAVLADHADVRRMLDEQRALGLGARGMVHMALVELELGQRPALADFLTPVCKVFCSEAGIRAADLGIQILGGYGYLDEYRIHQTWRDARITAIYEGANGIHARALASRGLRLQGGAGTDGFDALLGELTDAPAVMALRDDWRAARARLERMADPAPLAHDFMALTGQVLFRAVLARLAARQPGMVPATFGP